MAVQYARKWFHVSEYYQMLEAGILKTDDRVELINREVIEKSPPGARHAGCTRGE